MSLQNLENGYEFKLYHGKRDNDNQMIINKMIGRLQSISQHKDQPYEVLLTIDFDHFGVKTFSNYGPVYQFYLYDYIHDMLVSDRSYVKIELPNYDNDIQDYTGNEGKIIIRDYQKSYNLDKMTIDKIIAFLEVFGIVDNWEYDNFYDYLIISIQFSDIALQL